MNETYYCSLNMLRWSQSDAKLLSLDGRCCYLRSCKRRHKGPARELVHRVGKCLRRLDGAKSRYARLPTRFGSGSAIRLAGSVSHPKQAAMTGQVVQSRAQQAELASRTAGVS